MNDGSDRLLYVGQSRDLRRRLNSYRHIHPERHSRRMIRLVHEVRTITWELCDTPECAIRREEALLRSLRPRFNRAKTQPLRRAFLAAGGTADGIRLEFGDPEESASDTAALAVVNGYYAVRRVHAALARLLFAVQHQVTSSYQIPERLMSDRFAADHVFIPRSSSRRIADWIRWITDWIRAESIELLVQLNEQLPAPSSLSPFQRRWQASELATLTEFVLRRNPTLGVCEIHPSPNHGTPSGR